MGGVYVTYVADVDEGHWFGPLRVVTQSSEVFHGQTESVPADMNVLSHSAVKTMHS